MYSAQELVSQIDALTSLPTVYLRIREQLDAPDGGIHEVSRLIAADPALTTRLLRVVNSAMYGFDGTIDNVSRAVTILGLQQVHDLVLAMSLESVFRGVRPEFMDMNRFWRASVLRGLTARAIALSCRQSAPERIFVIGLLADIGHLVMYHELPTLAAEAASQARVSGEALHQVERRVIGCDFGEVGATLMDHWKLPACFAGVIGAQTVPRLGGEYASDACVVHLANHIVRADELGLSSNEASAEVDALVWATLGLQPDMISGIREEAELHLAAYMSLFFPGGRSL
ncbi:HDOD domain-containing protein [Thauera sp. 2A1]|mgnify:CR=1 FL=1|uniref:HDOD domain-containing protein n=1 Tax=Thauera sp. 2A1 TaxID=2570191 RepID=UPI0012915F19|nr:HDOD domain-containing protein [Thauera sp. 2A1]KAI5913784.1 HDOD domain-containing protein [Thauera sp. 2A1]MBS0551752.1 HDOD domain-containing protein [Pseudomonadota bacterium]